MNNPYKVLSSDDPILSPFQYQLPIDPCWVLVEMHGNNTIKRIVENDCGEPEDQTLARNFRWVVDELNRLHNELMLYKSNRNY